MSKSIKIELFESINILSNLARMGSSLFPNELCSFIRTEFNFNLVLLANETSRNSFNIIGSSNKENNFLNEKTLSVDNYTSIEESLFYESNLITECTLSISADKSNLQSFILNVGENFKYVLLLEHKVFPSDSDKNKFNEVSKFIQNFLFTWNSLPLEEHSNTNIYSQGFIAKTSKGVIKELNTANGLLTLIKEEQVSNSVTKYLGEIKLTNQAIIESLNDLTKLIVLEESGLDNAEITINLGNVINQVSENIKNKNQNVSFNFSNNVPQPITLNKNNIEQVLFSSLDFLASSTKSNVINISSNQTFDNKLRISLNTETDILTKEKLANLLEPFENKEIAKTQSGFGLTLLAKYIEQINGSLKFNQQEHVFSINLTLPLKNTSTGTKLEEIVTSGDTKKDRILVIESDNASSTLLNNYLSKWNYKTEIVASGNHALQLVRENKYVAVILNVEQENENSLELLQKIKNNKSTRNTPVIVFSVEAEKDKIYLMGSVEYLVKPINYNNLVEILTSYKLRRNSTVLCVDDDQPTLSLVKQAIQTAGFNVIAEHRPELVEDLIKDKDLDLAIIDLDMPIINGFELIKKIKSLDNFSKLPIIIYTGKEDYQEDLQKIDGMFVELLEKKSTSFNELEKTILDMIKSYEEPNIIEDSADESSGPKILMAEDYKHSQIIVTRLLKKSGFENIIVVENGEEALNICENDKIDVILMDMQMPVMNGFEATGKIRELEGYADTPIIALTAFAMKGDREKCLEAGATDYIPKPIDSKEFIEKVKYYTQVTVTT